MKKTILIATAFITLVAFNVFAQDDLTSTTTVTEPTRPIKPGGFFAEPFLTIGRDDSSLKTTQNSPMANDTSGNTDSAGVGARVGVHASQMVFLGVDGRYQRARLADSFYQAADGNLYNYGPFIGAQMPWYGVRAWAEYVLGGEFDPKPGINGFDTRFRDPRGYRVGAGIHYLEVSLNLEYQDLVYDTTQIQSIGRLPVASDSQLNFESKGFIVSLSFPIEM